MKRLLSLFVALLLCVSALPAMADGALTAGTYDVTADGFGGKIVLAVTVGEAGVTAVEVKEHSETEGIGAAALPVLLEKIRAAGYSFTTVGSLIYKEHYRIDRTGRQIADGA